MSVLGWLTQPIGGWLERNTIVARKIAVFCDVTLNNYKTAPLPAVSVHSVSLSLHPLASRCHCYRQEIKNQKCGAGCSGMLFILKSIKSGNWFHCWNHAYRDCANLLLLLLLLLSSSSSSSSTTLCRVFILIFLR